MPLPIDRDPLNLCPRYAADLSRCLSAWNLNHPETPIFLFEGMRSNARQAELFAMGRTTPSTSPCHHDGATHPVGSCPVHPLGATVTNAPPGSSFHNYGIGSDVVFDADPAKAGPQWTWKGPFDQLGRFAQSMGLEWAGAWNHFPEKDHLQKTYGLTINEAQELFRVGGLQNVWAAIEKQPHV